MAAALPFLIGTVGLAVDTVSWVFSKRQLQQVADSAAMAGVYALVQGTNADYAVEQEIGRSKVDDPRLSTALNYSPDGYDGDPMAIEVELSRNAPLSFTSLFVKNAFAITASATATVVESGDFCALALDAGSNTGILLKRDSTVELECGMAANSSGAQAIMGEYGSQLAAAKAIAFGGIQGNVGGSAVRAYSLRQKDPYKDLSAPEIPNTGCPNTTVNANASRIGGAALKPGCYGNLVLNGRVELQPGEYVLNGGNMIVGPNADVSCNGCTIILTSESASAAPGSVGKLRIDKRAKVRMSARREGPYSGILVYQDRRAAPDVPGEENILSGGSMSKLEGLIYFPAQSLTVDASAAPDMRCARLIGRRMVVQGRLVIARDCSIGGKSISFAAAQVRLVE